ncbi:MAG: (d)CMP kinase [Actinomycetota bacterium]|nr:(d)CMP kinase [Actinomycetota bacterium]
MTSGVRPAAGLTRGHPARAVIVAIDGPSGSGKSTVAREVARRLGLRYLDTGAMFRALTWQALQDRTDLEDADALGILAERTVLTVGTDPDAPAIAVNGEDVAGPIRLRPVSNAVSAVSAAPHVRARLLLQQREIIGAGGIVVEGRDIGTAVAPDAPVKVFLTASSEARALRRSQEVTGPTAGDVALTQAEIDRRDRLDSSRAASPLVPAPDAVHVDSTGRSVDDVVRDVLKLCADVGVPGVAG